MCYKCSSKQRVLNKNVCLAASSYRIRRGIISMWQKLSVGVPGITESNRIVSEIVRKCLGWNPALVNKYQLVCIFSKKDFTVDIILRIVWIFGTTVLTNTSLFEPESNLQHWGVFLGLTVSKFWKHKRSC